MSHIVLGAGPLGRATARALLARGEAVTVATRSGTPTGLPLGAQAAAVDLIDRRTAATLCQGAEALYFCAQPPYHLWAQQFPQLLDAVIDAAEASGARLILADNLYGYGQVDCAIVETLPLAPNSRKGRIRAAMHAMVDDAARAGRIQYAVARGSDFFGAGVEGSTVGSRLFDAVKADKTAVVIGSPDQPHSFTYVEDFGRALAMLGTDSRALGHIWHVPNAPALTFRQLVADAARLAGTRGRVRAASTLELSIIGLFIPAVREAIEMRYAFDRPFVVDHSKFAAAFGDIATPLDTALAATLAE